MSFLWADLTAYLLKIRMDEVCQGFVGMDGVYAAQARMREGKNTGEIWGLAVWFSPILAV